MHHILLRLPYGITIKSYGFMVMLGFLSAIWWAAYRAKKVKADPDAILDIGFISLLAGVVGARLFYVIQFWDEKFADQPHPLLAALNITAGGLVFYGGFFLAFACITLYLLVKRYSFRLYFDIMAPSVMLGLAFGRIGCFLNGCCWGAPTEKVPWAVTFPFASPPFLQHWQECLIDVPQQLLFTGPGGMTMPLSRDHIGLPAKYLQKPFKRLQDAREALKQAEKGGADKETLKQLQAELKKAENAVTKHVASLADLYYIRAHYGLTPSEIDALASNYRSLPVHPTQIYSSISSRCCCTQYSCDADVTA